MPEGNWNTDAQPNLPTIPVEETDFYINLMEEFNDVKEAFSTGFKPLYTTDVTTAPTENVSYQAMRAPGQIGDLEFDNLKLANGSAAPTITVTEADMDNPFVFLVYNASTNTWSKEVKTFEITDEFETFVGKNKYNKATNSLNSYLVGDGTTGVSANYQVSDFIPVLPNTRYRKGYMLSVNRAVEFYDENKEPIAFVAAGTTQSGMPSASDILTPAGCYYVRLELGNADAAGAQFELGTATTSYEAYTETKKLPAEKIDGLEDAPALLSYVHKTDLYETGKNIFDKTKATDGFYPSGTTGDLVANATLSATDYMPVTPNAAYYDPVLSQRAFYDINKVFVSGVAGPGGGGTFTVPNNPAIAYVRTTLQTAVKNTYQFEVGTVPTSYEPYRVTVKKSLIPFPVNEYWEQKNLTPLRNLHPELKDTVAPFMAKLQATDVVSYKPVVLVVLGDSFMAYINTSTTGVIDKTTSPPCATSANNLFSTIWKQLKRFMPDYKRFDNAGAFTETGTWTTYTGRTVDASWDDNQDREADTRYSTSAGASVAFNIASSYRMANFIDRTTPTGKVITVAITQGNGYMEVLQNNDWDANVWVEANGYSFSQLQTLDAANAIGNTEYQRRIYFRKTSGHLTDAVGITFTADGTTGHFCYWGMELVSKNNYLQVYNSARGQHTTTQILPYLQTDVWNKKPDFIFWEIPMCNNLNVPTFAYTLQGLQDTIEGNRSGAVNTFNMKAKTNNFADCQVVAYMPSFRQSYYNTDGTYKIATAPYTYRDICDRTIKYLNSQGIKTVDMERIYQQEVAVNPAFPTGNMYDAMAGSSLTGNTLTNDGTHLNDNAIHIWKQHTYIFD